MKIRIFPATMVVVISALVAYGFWLFNIHGDKTFMAACAFVTSAPTLFLVVAARFPLGRTTVNIAVVSGIFWVLFFVVNVVFTLWNFSPGVYVLVAGLCLSLYGLIVYALKRAEE